MIDIKTYTTPCKSRSGNYSEGTTVVQGSTTVVGGGSSVDIVKELDTTTLTDANVLSSKRVLKEISDRGHTHENKVVLDKLTQAVIDNSHTHANKATLDVIDQSLSTASAVKFAKVTANDAELGTIKATTADFSGAIKAAAATVIGLVTCATLNADAATIPNITATNINASAQVVSPLFVGHLQGNADTASRLQTARTIWGQSFDGSGNVQGNLYLGNKVSGLPHIEIQNAGWNVKHCIGCTYSGDKISISVNGLDNGSTATLSDTTLGAYIIRLGQANINFLYAASGSITATLHSAMFMNNSGLVGIGTTSPNYKLDVNGTMRVADTAIFDGNIGTSSYISQSSGWRVTAQGNADFRTIYTDELHATAFTADVSQALAGSDYLTKSVSKLSANFVVPAVGSSVRIIVDDLEGFPATQCFENGDYIRFRAFNRTSGLTISDVWGTVTLDTTYGSNGFLNGAQAYTFTCKATSGAGLTVFKGSEVLDYGTSGSGMISRTTLDSMGSPYEQIATWINDPSVDSNYTVHARLGNLGGIANCNGYGLYSNKAFLTDSVTVGDLTKTNNYLSYNPTEGLVIKGNLYVSSGAVASTNDVNTAKTSAIDTASNDATTKANSALTSAKSYADTGDGNTLTNAKSYTDTQFSVADGKITAAISTTKTYADNAATTAANNVQVGGRNLVLSSNRYIESTGGNKNIDFGLNYSSWRNNTITISIEVELKDAVVNRVGFEPAIIYSDNSMQYLPLWIYGDSTAVNIAKQRIFATFKIQDKEITDFAQKGIYIQTLTSGYAFVGYPKIELGNKPTDWTPAPEDVDASIATKVATTTYDAKMTLIDSQISSKVSQTDFNALGQRVSSAESSITQNATNIELKVAKDGVISAINQTSESVTINASKINLTGAVTISSMSSDALNTIQGYSTTAQNNLAMKLGYTDYTSLAASASLQHTLINGGYINTDCLLAHSIGVDKLVAQSITSDYLAAGAITTDKLAANAVTAAKINVSDLTANTAFINNLKTNIVNAAYVNTLGITSLGAVTAGSFNLGSGKFSVTADGTLNCTGATISGTINATSGTFGGTLSGVSGTIGGWTIQDGGLYNSVSGTGFIKLEVSGGRQLSINSSADSPVLAIRSDNKPALRIYTQDNGGAGIDITAQTTSWAVTSHGKVQLVSRNTEGTFINMLCKCQVVVTSSGTIGSTICWVDPVDNLQFMPNRILCINTSDITIYLPDTANIKDGYEIEFRHLWSNYVTIKSYNNLSNIVLNNSWYDNKTNQRTLDGAYIARYTWCASRAFWVEEYHL